MPVYRNIKFKQAFKTECLFLSIGPIQVFSNLTLPQQSPTQGGIYDVSPILPIKYNRPKRSDTINTNFTRQGFQQAECYSKLDLHHAQSGYHHKLQLPYLEKRKKASAFCGDVASTGVNKLLSTQKRSTCWHPKEKFSFLTST